MLSRGSGRSKESNIIWRGCFSSVTIRSRKGSLLLKMFQRKNKDGVLESTPSTWLEMGKNNDGNACMSVIEDLVTVAKMVPEAMIHLISRLLMAMD